MLRKRKTLVIVLSFLVVFLLFPTSASASLYTEFINDQTVPLQNPGFEFGLNYWSGSYWSATSGTSYALTDEDVSGVPESAKAYNSGGGSCTLTQDIAADQVPKLNGKIIQFSYYFKAYDERAKAIIEMDGGTPVESSWVYHSDYFGDKPWTEVSVDAYIYSASDWVRVKILIEDIDGVGTTVAYVDNARIRILDIKSGTQSTYGKVVLRSSLEHVVDQQGYRYAWLTVGVGADSYNTGGVQYYIGSVKIETYKYQSSDSATVNQIIEANDINYLANPAGSDQPRLIICAIAGGLVGAAANFATKAVIASVTGGVGAPAAIVAGAAVGATVGYVTTQFLQLSTESLSGHDTTSSSDSYTSIIWNHKRIGLVSPPQIPTEGSFTELLEWKYIDSTGHNLKITITVEFVKIVLTSNIYFNYYVTQVVYTRTLTTYIYP